MSEAVLLEFNQVAPEKYHAVNKLLGLDPITGSGDWPAGLMSHAGAVGAGDSLVVFEVWDSQASQATFMAERLGAALASAGLPPPVRVEWFSVEGTWTP